MTLKVILNLSSVMGNNQNVNTLGPNFVVQ
jgi:hypothetical protein